jgi:hypothetical protein
MVRNGYGRSITAASCTVSLVGPFSGGLVWPWSGGLIWPWSGGLVWPWSGLLVWPGSGSLVPTEHPVSTRIHEIVTGIAMIYRNC